MQVVELALHLVLGRGRRDKLHVVDAVHDIAVLLAAEVHLDLGHGKLLFRALGGVEDDADASVVEHNYGLHHADGLPQRAVIVVVGEGVLLEELILDNCGSLIKKHAQ